MQICGLDPPVVGKNFKRCSKFDYNHLTLRIEPFGEFRKKKFIFAPGMPGSHLGLPNT